MKHHAKRGFKKRVMTEIEEMLRREVWGMLGIKDATVSVSQLTDSEIRIRVQDPEANGPHYFDIKIKETY